jgi:hypothetical protein
MFDFKIIFDIILSIKMKNSVSLDLSLKQCIGSDHMLDNYS